MSSNDILVKLSNAGISKNEKKDFTLTLPLDWKEENLQGKNVKFEVECLEIQEKILYLAQVTQMLHC